MCREPVLGGLVLTWRGKNLRFTAKGLQCCRRG